MNPEGHLRQNPNLKQYALRLKEIKLKNPQLNKKYSEKEGK